MIAIAALIIFWCLPGWLITSSMVKEGQPIDFRNNFCVSFLCIWCIIVFGGIGGLVWFARFGY
jgi:hypothetical protein